MQFHIESKVLHATVALLLLAACGKSGDASRGIPLLVPPLVMNPTSIPANATTLVTVSAVAHDDYADFASIGGFIVSTDGTRTEPSPQPLTWATAPSPDVNLTLQLNLRPPSTGVVHVGIFVIDAKGNRSNTLEGDITVE